MITFDSLMLQAFLEEQRLFFIGARINKIQQPTRREILLSVRNGGIAKQLYINIDPKFYHICFTDNTNLKKKNIEIPQKPPMFCMLLRKYLNNAKIAKVNQPDGDRILELYFETYNEIGDIIYLCLAIELMGKYSNVILYNCDTNIILGCAHNVGSDKSQVREVYGQIPYMYPPKPEENSFFSERYAFLQNCYKCDIHDLYNAVYQERCFNDVVDNYYTHIIAKNKFKILQSNYMAIVNKLLKKITKNLHDMEYQVDKSRDVDKYRLYGDLIMANLYNLNDFSSFVNVYDYENNKNISITLDESKSLKDNANIFYKRYSKGKNSVLKLSEFIEQSKQKKQYYEQLLYSINAAKKLEDLFALADEVEADKPLEKYDKKSIEPEKIELENETRIYIGKNNKQNDYIISKLASEDDLWFHTKDCPGSHVLLKTQNITDKLILYCAKLAKKYSSCANSSKIGVIYTKRKYLRKPPAAALGYVTYKNEKEIIID